MQFRRLDEVRRNRFRHTCHVEGPLSRHGTPARSISRPRARRAEVRCGDQLVPPTSSAQSERGGSRLNHLSIPKRSAALSGLLVSLQTARFGRLAWNSYGTEGAQRVANVWVARGPKWLELTRHCCCRLPLAAVWIAWEGGGRRFESVRGLRHSACSAIVFVFRADAGWLVRRPRSVHQREREGAEGVPLRSAGAKGPDFGGARIVHESLVLGRLNGDQCDLAFGVVVDTPAVALRERRHTQVRVTLAQECLSLCGPDRARNRVDGGVDLKTRCPVRCRCTGGWRGARTRALPSPSSRLVSAAPALQ